MNYFLKLMVKNYLSTPVNFVLSMYITHIINIEQLVIDDFYTNKFKTFLETIFKFENFHKF